MSKTKHSNIWIMHHFGYTKYKHIIFYSQYEYVWNNYIISSKKNRKYFVPSFITTIEHSVKNDKHRKDS